MEAHLWRLSLLVRCQDRAQDLRLFRDEPQRKLLDSRFYEVNGDYCNNQSINQSIHHLIILLSFPSHLSVLRVYTPC